MKLNFFTRLFVRWRNKALGITEEQYKKILETSGDSEDLKRAKVQKVASNSLYHLSSSPHFHDGQTTEKIMLTVIIALLPECIAGVYLFGIPALITIFASVTSAVLFEFLFQKLTRSSVSVGNLSAIVTGLMLALVSPPTIPIWMIMLGSFIAIVVAKGLFGGLGSNVFNPALTGRAALFIGFPAAMGANWVLPLKMAKTFSSKVLDSSLNVTSATTAIDAVTTATPLSLVAKQGFSFDKTLIYQSFLGYKSGCIGEVSIMLIMLSFIYLLVSGIIDFRTPLSMILTVFILTFLSSLNHGVSFALSRGLFSLLTGGLMFGAVFMASDYATTPVTKLGRVIFGFGAGLLTFLIRNFGSYPEGVMFSILIMNATSPFLNNLTARMYGYKRR